MSLSKLYKNIVKKLEMYFKKASNGSVHVTIQFRFGFFAFRLDKQ